MSDETKAEPSKVKIFPGSKMKVLADRSERFDQDAHDDVVTLARCFLGGDPERRRGFSERLLAVGALLRTGNFRWLNCMQPIGGDLDGQAMAAGLAMLNPPELGDVPRGNVQGQHKPGWAK